MRIYAPISEYYEFLAKQKEEVKNQEEKENIRSFEQEEITVQDIFQKKMNK